MYLKMCQTVKIGCQIIVTSKVCSLFKSMVSNTKKNKSKNRKIFGYATWHWTDVLFIVYM